MTPEYEERMMDVLEVYERPYDPNCPVVCADEKSTQLLEDSRQSIPTKPGKIKKQDYEYKRNGTANIFVAVEPKGKKRHLKVTRRRKGWDFAGFIFWLVTKKYKYAKKIVLVLDNLNTHVGIEKVIINRYGKKLGQRIIEKLEVHYTPKHASWLNMAEIEINVYSNQCLKRRTPTIEELTKHTRAYTKRRNKNQATINWQFTREKAKQKFNLPNHNILQKLREWDTS